MSPHVARRSSVASKLQLAHQPAGRDGRCLVLSAEKGCPIAFGVPQGTKPQRLKAVIISDSLLFCASTVGLVRWHSEEDWENSHFSDPEEGCWLRSGSLISCCCAACPRALRICQPRSPAFRICCVPIVPIAGWPLSSNVSRVSDPKASTVTCTEPMTERGLLRAGELSFFLGTHFLTLLWFLLLSLLPSVCKMSHTPRGNAEGTVHLRANRDGASEALLCLWAGLNTVNKKQQWAQSGVTRAKSHPDLIVNLMAVLAPVRSGILNQSACHFLISIIR